MIRYLFFLQNFTACLPLSILLFPLHFFLFTTFSLFFFFLYFSFPIVSDAFLLIILCSSSPFIKHIFAGGILLVALVSDFYQFVPFLLEVYALKNIFVYIHIKDIESKNIITKQKKWTHTILRIFYLKG